VLWNGDGGPCIIALTLHCTTTAKLETREDIHQKTNGLHSGSGCAVRDARPDTVRSSQIITGPLQVEYWIASISSRQGKTRTSFYANVCLCRLGGVGLCLPWTPMCTVTGHTPVPWLSQNNENALDAVHGRHDCLLAPNRLKCGDKSAEPLTKPSPYSVIAHCLRTLKICWTPASESNLGRWTDLTWARANSTCDSENGAREMSANGQPQSNRNTRPDRPVRDENAWCSCDASRGLRGLSWQGTAVRTSAWFRAVGTRLSVLEKLFDSRRCSRLDPWRRTTGKMA